MDYGWTMDGARPFPETLAHTFTFRQKYVCVCAAADVMCKAPRVTLNKPYKPLQVVKP